MGLHLAQQDNKIVMAVEVHDPLQLHIMLGSAATAA